MLVKHIKNNVTIKIKLLVTWLYYNILDIYYNILDIYYNILDIYYNIRDIYYNILDIYYNIRDIYYNILDIYYNISRMLVKHIKNNVTIKIKLLVTWL
jgi:hypothetical protein